MRLERVTVQLNIGIEPQVLFSVVPTGTSTTPIGKANVPQHLIDNLKATANKLRRAFDYGNA